MARIKFFDEHGNIVLPYLGEDDGLDVYTGDFLCLPRPAFATLRFEGEMPTDESDARTPTELTVTMRSGLGTMFKAKCQLSIQGHGSVYYQKKGYTLDLLNEGGDALEIKFGDMPAVDSFHLKAYATDMTHTRGLSGPQLWRQMVGSLNYPKNLVNNLATSLSTSQKKNEVFCADAKYTEDGFPCEVYLNGNFFGLYTLKLKKSRQNYAMDKSDKSCIFLDSTTTYSAFFSQAFYYRDWELRNPKLSGYDAGGEITDAAVLANIERLFTFLNDLSTMYGQHEDYIVLDHWMCWYIVCELTTHRDTSGNNYEVTTWDGTHWSLLPYDMDVTVGLNAWADYTIETSVTGWTVATQPSTGDKNFWATFRTVYGSELSALYTKLRKSGIISIENLTKIYKGRASVIPADVYKADLSKWGTIWTNGMPTIRQTISVLESRIEFLDSQWFVE